MVFILVLEGGGGCNLLGLMGRKRFFISKPNRFGLSGLSITKPETELNRTFF
jgi:hypothetical protein